MGFGVRGCSDIYRRVSVDMSQRFQGSVNAFELGRERLALVVERLDCSFEVGAALEEGVDGGLAHGGVFQVGGLLSVSS